jgi:hypothetical protein
MGQMVKRETGADVSKGSFIRWQPEKDSEVSLPSPEQAMTTGNEVWSRVGQVDGGKDDGGCVVVFEARYTS